mgnify:CR=1 FL=1
MVKVTKDVAQQNRDSLLLAAGQKMRAEGVQAATVAAIAGQVGLTHGAIYRQFESKDALAAAAITADFDRILAVLERIDRDSDRYGRKLRIVTRDIEAYERFFFEKLSMVPGIQEVNSIVALSEIKSTTSLPV